MHCKYKIGIIGLFLSYLGFILTFELLKNGFFKFSIGQKEVTVVDETLSDEFSAIVNNSSQNVSSGLNESTNKDKPVRRLPDALIIGVKKCGTGALREFIRLHPDVYAPSTEVHFFDRWYDYGIHYYVSRLPLVEPGKLLLEKTPAYFHDEYVTNRLMRTFGPKIKFIVVVRNPVDRMISDFVHDKILQLFSPSFHSLAFTNNETGNLSINTAFGPVIRSSYIIHLRRFLQTGFNLTNFLFLDGENLVENPAEELQRIERFLDLRPMITKSIFQYQEEKGFPCVKNPFQFADGSIREGGLGSKEKPQLCLGDDKGRPSDLKPKLTDEEREMFVRYFAPLNVQYFEATGTVYPKWQCYKKDKCV